MPPPYVIDASVWINVWRAHPPDRYVSVWARIDAAVADDTIRSPEDVRQELERGTDDLADFLSQRDGLFAPLDEAQMAAVREVQTRCEGLADEDGERNRADPFVVALARVRQGTVVTAERGRRDANGRPRIPDACQEFGLPCLDWFGFLREVDWVF